MDRPAGTLGTGRRGWYLDAGWYSASAAFSWLVWLAADVPLQRSWGAIAFWSYVAAIPTTLVLSRTSLRHGGRLLVAVAVMAGGAVAPLAVAAAERAPGDRGATAQSEVLIVEEAATALLDERNPYAARYDVGPLADRPEPTRTHVPYPPGMLGFGLPKAVGGAGPLTDARWWFLAAALAIAVPALRWMRADDPGRLLVFQVLFVLPTGALPIATGGHDVPVLAALLLSFALAAAGRPAAAGLAGAAALAMRQTSILALPFVMALVPGARRGRTVAASLLPALALTLPFLLWDPGAFVEDVVRFPLGLGTGLSSAGTPTLGSLLIEAAPTARTGITIGLVVAIVGVTGALLGIRPPRTAATATARAAVAFATAIALAPAARFGYVVYPLSLLAWALAFSRGDRADRSDPASP